MSRYSNTTLTGYSLDFQMSHRGTDMRQVICPYCDQQARYMDSKHIYHGVSYGMSYVCLPCQAWVGVHKGSDKPLGRLANAELRSWKIKAHAAFDPLWKSKKMSRGAAYRLLQDKLGIDKSECHIGMFDVDTCKRTIEVLT